MLSKNNKNHIGGILFIFLLILGQEVFAQTNSEEDKILTKAEKICDDAALLAIKNTGESRRKAWEKTGKARELYRKINDIFSRESWCLSNIGLQYSFANQTGEALKYYGEALKLAESKNDQSRQIQILHDIGGLFTFTDQIKGFDYYQKAFDLAQKNGQEKLIISTSDKLAFHFSLMPPVKGNRVLEKIDLDSLKIKNKKTEARFLKSLGEVYEGRKKLNKALEAYNKSLSLAEKSGDKKAEADLSYRTGHIYGNRAEPEKARARFERSLSLFREQNNKLYEYGSLKYLGSVYFGLGNSQKGYQLLEDSIKIARELNNKELEASSLHFIGDFYRTNGEHDKALIYFQKSLETFKSTKGNERFVLMIMRNLAGEYVRLRDTKRALEILNESFELAEKQNSRGEKVILLESIGDVYKQTGEYQKSMEYYQKAKALIDELEAKKENMSSGDRSFILATRPRNLSNFAGFYTEIGDPYEALTYHWMTLTTGRMTRQYGLVSYSYSYFAQSLATYINLKDRALKLGEELLAELKGSRYEPSILEGIGDVHNATRDFPKALEIYRRALDLYLKRKDKTGEISLRHRISKTHFLMGNKEQTLLELQKVLAITRETGDPGSQAYVLKKIGEHYHLTKENQKALDTYKTALQLFKLTGDKSYEAKTLGLLSSVAHSEGNKKLSVFYLKSAVNILQEVRTASQGIDNQTQKSLLAKEENSYRALTAVLIKEKRLSEALEVLNTFKDQEFFDFNKEDKNKPETLTLTPRESEFAARYKTKSEDLVRVGEQLTALKRRVGKSNPDNAELLKLEEQEKKASKEFGDFLKLAETEFSKPTGSQDKIGPIADVTELQKTLADLNTQTGQKPVAIYTLLNDLVFRALIVTPDKITAVESPVEGEEISNYAQTLWGLLQSPKYDPTIASKKLYEAVFKPIEKELPEDTTTLMWSLDGNLRYIPVAALFDGEKYLVERYQNTIFTRTDRAGLTRDVKPVWTGVGFGSSKGHNIKFLEQKFSFSALPGVDAELKAIFKQADLDKGILKGEILPDEKFNKGTMLSVLKKRNPLVHIASHFSFRPGDETRSFLLLGDGTAFPLSEIKTHKDLFQDVELLTLSACNTAAQQSGATGREVDGFAELAQRLGAGAVMATLWQVSDASTPVLMSNFYKIREGENGMTKAKALRQAQIALLKGTEDIVAEKVDVPEANSASKVKVEILSETVRPGQDPTRAEIFYIGKNDAPLYNSENKPKFAHPYYWSPFVLYGNWK